MVIKQFSFVIVAALVVVSAACFSLGKDVVLPSNGDGASFEGMVIFEETLPIAPVFGDWDDPGRHVCTDRKIFRSCLLNTNIVCNVANGDNLHEGVIPKIPFFSELKVSSLSQARMELVKNLAYEFLYKEARARSFPRFDRTDFPDLLPVNFRIDGHWCALCDLVLIPFEIKNQKCRGRLEEVVCKFYHGDDFLFALYANLNTMSMSYDFYSGSSCEALLSGIPKFPFLDLAEECRQNEKIATMAHEASTLTNDGRMDEIAVDVNI